MRGNCRCLRDRVLCEVVRDDSRVKPKLLRKGIHGLKMACTLWCLPVLEASKNSRIFSFFPASDGGEGARDFVCA